MKSTIESNIPLVKAGKKPPHLDLEEVGRELLLSLGEDTARQGLKNTPARFAKAMGFLTSGNKVNLQALVGDAVFDEPSSELVLVRDIEFYSLCEHHLLPFFGKVHVAYLPAGKVIGLSKIPRIVDS